MLTTLWKLVPREPKGLMWVAGNRKAAHRLLMGALGASGLDPRDPRAEACLTWWHDPESSVVLARVRSDLALGGRGLMAGKVADPAERALADGWAEIDIDFARQYRPLLPVDPDVRAFLEARGKPLPNTMSALSPVGEGALGDWTRAKLQRAGLEVHQLEVQPVGDAQLSRQKRERVPVARLRARVSSLPGAPEALAHLIHHGFGRAKNYGLGMVRVATR